MDFLVKDLIKPNYYPSLENNEFNKEIVEILNTNKILFDTLFYGATGSGKLTLLLGYLQKLYGPEALNLFPNISKKNDEDSLSLNADKVGVPLSNHNIILFNDSVSDETIQDFMKEYNELQGDNLNYIVFVHLNRLKEKTLSMLTAFIDTRKSKTYILGTCSKSNVLTQRFKSRFEIYQISRPTVEELTNHFYNLIPSKFDFQKSRISKIVESTNRDMKLSIIYINQRLLELIDPTLKKKSIDNFKYYLGCLLQMVIKNELNKLPIIRSMILTIYQSSLFWNDYIKKVLDVLFQNTNSITISTETKIKIISKTAELDHKVQLSKPTYIHYEAFIFMIYNILHGTG
jgi:hypothetical protein